MQVDCLFGQRPTLACRSQRSILGDQSGQERYLIVQSAGEVRLCSAAQARSIASKSGYGTAVIDVVAVGWRQIPVYVAPKSSGGLIDGGPCHFGELGIPLGDCRSEYLGHQVGLRLKVVIKATLRKAGMLHQFAQPDGLHSPFSEEPRRRGNHRPAAFRSLFSLHAHTLLLDSLPPPELT